MFRWSCNSFLTFCYQNTNKKSIKTLKKNTDENENKCFSSLGLINFPYFNVDCFFSSPPCTAVLRNINCDTINEKFHPSSREFSLLAMSRRGKVMKFVEDKNACKAKFAELYSAQKISNFPKISF